MVTYGICRDETFNNILYLRTKIFCISGVPMNDSAQMKNCPFGGCMVGQISSRGNVWKIDILFSDVPIKKTSVSQCMVNKSLSG